MYVQVKIGTHKIDLSSVTSKCGSKDNMQHTPRGGEKKVPVSAACHCVAGPKLRAGRGETCSGFLHGSKTWLQNERALDDVQFPVSHTYHFPAQHTSGIR